MQRLMDGRRILDHKLMPGITYILKDIESWEFVAHDLSSGKMEVKRFKLHFESAHLARIFKIAIDRALEMSETSSSSSSSISDMRYQQNVKN